MPSTRCYLCGRSGADTVDHVPPKCFLEAGNYQGTPRLTVGAHRKCNAEFSDDEEYVRDLLAPAAEELGLEGVSRVISSAERSRKRDAGFKRRQEILKYAKVIEKRTSTGLYAGKALGVRGDMDRVKRVGAKIARGIMYHDAAAILKHDEVICVPLPLYLVPDEREKELKRCNPYWERLSSRICLHDTFADSVAVRRFCFGHPTLPAVTIECNMAVILLSVFYVVGAFFAIPEHAPSSLPIGIDESTGAWLRSEGDAEHVT